MLIQHVLVASDFSKYSSMAEQRAAMLCKTYQCNKAEIITIEKPEAPQILAVLKKSTADKEESLIIEEALRELEMRAYDLLDRFQVNFKCVVKLGQPAHEIAAYSNATHADLLVAGAHGGNFFSALFVGNTIDKLMRLIHCPLLVVKKDCASDYRHILVPVDFTEDSLQAACLALALQPQGLITLLHAYEVGQGAKMSYAGVNRDMISIYRKQAHEQARESMSLFIDKLNAPDRIFRRQIVADLPSLAIRQYAEKFKPDLIVMGKHGYSRVEELLIGSVTRDTVAQTQCDILIVPSKGAAATHKPLLLGDG